MQKRSLNGLRRKLFKYMFLKVRESNRLFQEYVNKIKEAYPRSTIILYGSRARGDYLPYSDYDLAIILESVEDKFRVIEEIRSLKPLGLDLDLIILSPRDLEDPIIKNMLRHSKMLYNGLGVKIDY